MDAPTPSKVPAEGALFDRDQWLVVSVAAVSIALLGAIFGFTLGFGTRHLSNTNEAQRAAVYDAVRMANIGPMEQALGQVDSDCRVGDAGRCSLSFAYILALDQKFLDELGRVSVPGCASSSDQRLKAGLQQLQLSASHALAVGGPQPAALVGVSDIQASDAMYAAARC